MKYVKLIIRLPIIILTLMIAVIIIGLSNIFCWLFNTEPVTPFAGTLKSLAKDMFKP